MTLPNQIQAIILNQDGTKSLSRLQPEYMNHDGLILCQKILDDTNHFFDVVVIPQINEDAKTLHLLIPIHFVDLVVLDDASKTIGFVQQATSHDHN